MSVQISAYLNALQVAAIELGVQGVLPTDKFDELSDDELFCIWEKGLKAVIPQDEREAFDEVDLEEKKFYFRDTNPLSFQEFKRQFIQAAIRRAGRSIN
jgi:hypothetical protein